MKKMILLLLCAFSLLNAVAQSSGTIVAFAGPKTKVPTGWVICDGKLYNKSDVHYRALFNAIGVSWGGDGVNMFAVPDLRGTFIRGVNDNGTSDPEAAGRSASRPDLNSAGNSGNAVGSKQTDMFASHSHDAVATVSRTNINGSNLSHDADGGSDKWNSDPNYGSLSVSVVVKPNGGSETRPKNAYVYYIIKL